MYALCNLDFNDGLEPLSPVQIFFYTKALISLLSLVKTLICLDSQLFCIVPFLSFFSRSVPDQEHEGMNYRNFFVTFNFITCIFVILYQMPSTVLTQITSDFLDVIT